MGRCRRVEINDSNLAKAVCAGQNHSRVCNTGVVFRLYYELGRARGPERDNIAISRLIFGVWT